MPEKRKPRADKTRRATTQRTLRDIFQKTDTKVDSTVEREIVESTPIVTQVTRTSPAGAPTLAQAAARLPIPKQGQPTRLYPIFTKVIPSLETPSVDVGDVEVIDIPDTSSESVASETEVPQWSSRRLSPCLDLGSSQTLSHFADIQDGKPHEDEISEICRHKDERRRRLVPKSWTDLPKRVGYGSGSRAPLPDFDSQHVRGPQHAYITNSTPTRRESRLTLPPVHEGSTLDFLRKQQSHGDPSACTHDYIRILHQYLTRDEQKVVFESITRPHAEVHAAICRLSPDRMDNQEGPLQNAEMWTHRFRPRCVSEVLGNERHVRFLRDWLRALHLRENNTEDSTPTKGRPRVLESYARGMKRGRVVRAVTKKQRGRKKRRIDSEDELDDFVVSSDADEDSMPCDFAEDQSEDEFEFCQRTLSRIHWKEAADRFSANPVALPIHTDSMLGPPDYAQTDLNISDNLTNTLLITGPPGCGKTAAVYACAEELGWEVFEVYPGIGRRNGANINHLVGDVGKNHIIKTIHNRLSEMPAKVEGRRRPVVANIFEKGKKTRPSRLSRSRKAGTAEEPITIENDGPIDIAEICRLETGGEQKNNDGGTVSQVPKPDIRQSLLLLEEVDILFKEDAGFWTTVVELIRDCKRPVVLTCNDVRLVPVTDLPLQTILVFEPCPTPLAVTFLGCLSLREGCLVAREDLEVLYESTHTLDGVDAPDAPLCPRTEPIPVPDLRRSINQLQMMCASAARGSRSKMLHGDREAARHVRRSGEGISGGWSGRGISAGEECKWWRRMSNETEVQSYVNSQLCRPVLRAAEALSFALSEPSLDEEIGHGVLYMGWHASDTREGLEYLREDEVIAEETMRLSRGIQEETGTEGRSIGEGASQSWTERGSFRTRVGYQRQMGEVLERITDAGGPLMPQGSVFVDYIPWVRRMVEVDEGLERVAEKGASGRLTRNSMRTRHVRNIELGDRERAMLAGTRLGAV